MWYDYGAAEEALANPLWVFEGDEAVVVDTLDPWGYGYQPGINSKMVTEMIELRIDARDAIVMRHAFRLTQNYLSAAKEPSFLAQRAEGDPPGEARWVVTNCPEALGTLDDAMQSLAPTIGLLNASHGCMEQLRGMGLEPLFTGRGPLAERLPIIFHLAFIHDEALGMPDGAPGGGARPAMGFARVRDSLAAAQRQLQASRDRVERAFEEEVKARRAR